jgi:hypothetical protein
MGQIFERQVSAYSAKAHVIGAGIIVVVAYCAIQRGIGNALAIAIAGISSTHRIVDTFLKKSSVNRLERTKKRTFAWSSDFGIDFQALSCAAQILCAYSFVQIGARLVLVDGHIGAGSVSVARVIQTNVFFFAAAVVSGGSVFVHAGLQRVVAYQTYGAHLVIRSQRMPGRGFKN